MCLLTNATLWFYKLIYYPTSHFKKSVTLTTKMELYTQCDKITDIRSAGRYLYWFYCICLLLNYPLVIILLYNEIFWAFVGDIMQSNSLEIFVQQCGLHSFSTRVLFYLTISLNCRDFSNWFRDNRNIWSMTVSVYMWKVIFNFKVLIFFTRLP